MTGFIERHSDNILGQLSCFDRIIIQGTLPDICYPGAITSFFYRSGIRIFDFKQWASPMRDVINESTRSIASDNGLEIEFILKRNFRKEERVEEIIAERGDHPGLVHIFSAMETCTAFKPWHDKKSHKTFFKYDSGRCLNCFLRQLKASPVKRGMPFLLIACIKLQIGRKGTRQIILVLSEGIEDQGGTWGL